MYALRFRVLSEVALAAVNGSVLSLTGLAQGARVPPHCDIASNVLTGYWATRICTRSAKPYISNLPSRG
jgi:hypothetical protein